MLKPPKIIYGKEPYYIEKQLAKSDVSEVYLARGEESGKQFAIKSFGDVCEFGMSANYDRELGILRILSGQPHANVLSEHEGVNHFFRKYIVSPYIRGGTIRDVEMGTQIALSPRQAKHVVLGVCDGLDNIHSLGVLHRDIKLANILLDIHDPEEKEVTLDMLNSAAVTPKIFDFDCAWSQGKSIYELKGNIVGTEDFIAPEVWTRDGATSRSDIYSLGVALFVLHSSAFPFTGKSKQEYHEKHVQAPPPNPQSLNPSLSSDVAHIILKTLEKDPDKRYQTAMELKADVEAVF